MSDKQATKNVLICGLQDSGKSSFLGSLWHLLHSGECETKLQYGGLPANRERLNRLADVFRKCERLGRTQLADAEVLTVQLKADGRRLELTLPDSSGETWRDLWETRKCTQSIADLIQASDGVMLFLHSDYIDTPLPVVTVTQQAELIEQIEDNGYQPEGRQAQPSEEAVEYNPRLAATQAKLVDILQLLARPPLGGPEKRRLVVAVSAWDIAMDEGISPTQFVETYLPLLGQFLKNSKDYAAYRIYGISALGGSVPTDAERLSTMAQQSDRIIVVDDSGERSCDLTRPLGWLLEQQEKQ